MLRNNKNNNKNMSDKAFILIFVCVSPSTMEQRDNENDRTPLSVCFKSFYVHKTEFDKPVSLFASLFSIGVKKGKQRKVTGKWVEV